LIYGAVGLFVLVMAGIVWALAVESMPAIRRFGLRFIVGRNWDPVAESFGALPFIYGTIVSSLVAMLIAVPLALGAAVFLAELAPFWIRSPVGFLIELLAAVPSVVYGLWGIFVLAPFLRVWVQPALGSVLGFLPLFQGAPYGVGMLAAGLILSIMVVPYITAVSREVLLAVPNSQREAALGLGATRWETTRLAVLRYGRSGLVGAVLLGLGRALGFGSSNARATKPSCPGSWSTRVAGSDASRASGRAASTRHNPRAYRSRARALLAIPGENVSGARYLREPPWGRSASAWSLRPRSTTVQTGPDVASRTTMFAGLMSPCDCCAACRSARA